MTKEQDAALIMDIGMASSLGKKTARMTTSLRFWNNYKSRIKASNARWPIPCFASCSGPQKQV